MELVSGIADASERQQFYTAAMRTSANQPPAKFVKWLAEPLETAPYLKDDFSRMAGRWSEKARYCSIGEVLDHYIVSIFISRMSPGELATHIENSDLSEWTYPLRPPGWRRANGSPSYADQLRLLLMEEIYEISEDMKAGTLTVRKTFFK